MSVSLFFSFLLSSLLLFFFTKKKRKRREKIEKEGDWIQGSDENKINLIYYFPDPWDPLSMTDFLLLFS